MAHTLTNRPGSGPEPIRPRKKQWPFPLNLYQTAVGRKWVMAVTGIMLLGYVLVHMIGNLHLYEGPVQIHEYAEALRGLGGHLVPRTLVLWILRIGLALAFVLHIHSAATLTRMSAHASDKTDLVGQKSYPGGRDYVAANFASRTMRWTGPIILLYLFFHLADLTWGWWLGDDYIRGDVYHNVTESMSNIPVAILYIVANVALAVHIYHGAWSMFQSLGVNSPKYNKLRRNFAAGFATLILVGNLSFPIMVQAGVLEEDQPLNLEALNTGHGVTP